jgi:hypothetical protein
MRDLTKIMLSPEELQLVIDSDWILTKCAIIDKAIALFNELLPAYHDIIKERKELLPIEAISISPKISKGENYKGLPWVVLDHPRCFNGKDIFAIRTMFWWGNFFSITLHLSGRYTALLKRTAKDMDLNKDFICVNEDQWQHHFEEGNYKLAGSLSQSELQKHLTEKEFIKIARMFPLPDWNNIQPLLMRSFEKMIDLVIS